MVFYKSGEVVVCVFSEGQQGIMVFGKALDFERGQVAVLKKFGERRCNSSFRTDPSISPLRLFRTRLENNTLIDPFSET